MSGAPEIATFKVNGTLLAPDEPYPFLDQAHAVNACLVYAVAGKELGDDVLEQAMRAVETLIHLAAFGLAVMDDTQARRRSGRAS